MGLSESVEEYLEAIHRLSATPEGVSTTDLARQLDVTPASVTGMRRRLFDLGLITYQRYRDIALTPSGGRRAHEVIRRHRLAERLLTDVLGVPLAEAHDEACRLEHAVSPALEVRMAEALGEPKVCPHGHPLDPAAADRTMSLAEAAERAAECRGAIIGRGALSDLDYGVAVAAEVAEVEVDRETGQVELKRLICAQDVGIAINPMSVEGQIEGAASQGVGYALSEEYVYDGAGQLLNDDFMDFRMPTSLDHPEFDVALIEERKDKGPYGAKGVGEPPR